MRKNEVMWLWSAKKAVFYIYIYIFGDIFLKNTKQFEGDEKPQMFCDRQ